MKNLGRQPKEVTELQRSNEAEAAVVSSYVNRCAVFQFDDDLFSVVFGFVAGFPNADGQMKPHGATHPGLLMRRRDVENFVNTIARNVGIVPNEAAIRAYAEKQRASEGDGR